MKLKIQKCGKILLNCVMAVLPFSIPIALKLALFRHVINIKSFDLFDIKVGKLWSLMSAIMIIIPFLVFSIDASIKKSDSLTKKTSNHNYRGWSFDSKLALFTVCLTISMWCLQYLSDTHNEDFVELSWYERAAFSFYHTLKAFGADDNFLGGMQYIANNITKTCFFSATVYKIYATVLSFVAPITSFAIFFELLARFIPKFKLFILKIFPWKKKYYFSELNERSLALATSILNTEKGISPVIVFTDVYANKVQESTTELLAEAKRIGAICLRDDITHIKEYGLVGRKIFLIDNNEIVNLQTLTTLANASSHKYFFKTEVYLFCQDYIYTDVEKQLRNKLEKKKFVLLPVRCYRNLITNMLEKTPLYEPIIHKRKNNPDAELNLNVTILGIGDIGTEMFLTTYWIGQMLNCKLNINVISRESEEEFWGKIDYINPEIRRSTQKYDEILRIYSKNKIDEHGNDITFADPYCKVKYYSCDIQSEEFNKLFEIKNGANEILNTHYFLVSLGSDQANLSVANTLKTRIGTYHIKKERDELKTIINYVVYNANLSDTLNTNPYIYSCNNSPDNNSPDIYMQAVGGIKQIYRADNIFMNDYIPGAEAAAKSYSARQRKSIREDAFEKRLKDEYTYWSNLALRLHFKYKVFSVHPFTVSIFNQNGNREQDFIEKCEKYKKDFRHKPAKESWIKSKLSLFKGKDKKDNEKEIIVPRKTLPNENDLQWLEHRRWCAFIRTMGFRQTFDYKKYVASEQSHKHMDLKLHPCLVECNKNGIIGGLDKNSQPVSYISFLVKEIENKENIETFKANLEEEEKEKKKKEKEKEKKEKEIILCWDEIKELDNRDYDLLDKLSYDLICLKNSDETLFRMKKFSPYDFKQYDYPNNDYLDNI